MNANIETAAALDQGYSLSIRSRTLWWFGLAIGPVLPVILIAGGPPFFALSLYAIGLAGWIPDSLFKDSAGHTLILAHVIGVGFYLAHFLCSMFVRSRTPFVVLMCILLLAVVLNIIGFVGEVQSFQGT